MLFLLWPVVLAYGQQPASIDVRSSIVLDAPLENVSDAVKSQFSLALSLVGDIRRVDVDSSIVSFSVFSSRDGESVKAKLSEALRDGSLQRALRFRVSPSASVLVDESLRRVAASRVEFSSEESSSGMMMVETIAEMRKLEEEGSYSYDFFSYSFDFGDDDETAAPTPLPTPMPSMMPTGQKAAVISITHVLCPSLYATDPDLFDTFEKLKENQDEAMAYASSVAASTSFFNESQFTNLLFSPDETRTAFCQEAGLVRRRRLDDSLTPLDTATVATSNITREIDQDDDLSEDEIVQAILSDLTEAAADNTTCDVYAEERAEFTDSDFECGVTAEYNVTVAIVELTATEAPSMFEEDGPTALPTPLPSPVPSMLPTPAPSTMPTMATTELNPNILFNTACDLRTVNYGHRFSRLICYLISETVGESQYEF